MREVTIFGKRDLRTGWLIILLFAVLSCEESDEMKLNGVDLRYNAEDSYFVTASSPEHIGFEVKSTMPWKVYGTQDWHTIAPAEGEADKIKEVTISVQENTGLDDRTDTITIQSDYWIGKRFTITQKGIAYLTTDEGGSTTLTKDMDSGSFSVLSNQDWSCAVTQGADWLTITSGQKGTLDGEVVVRAKPNKGEVRKGTVTIYDRHDMVSDSVIFTQEGVLIEPFVETFLRSFHEGGIVSFDVSSNTEWTISIPDKPVWIDIISGNLYTENATVEIRLDAHPGSVLRSVDLIIETVGEPGDPTTKIRKTVVLKQAPEMKAERYEFTELGVIWQRQAGDPVFENGDGVFNVSKDNPEEQCRVIRTATGLGTYSFRLKETRITPGDKSNVYINFAYGPGKEIRYFVSSTGSTNISVQSKPNVWPANTAIDLSVPHTLTIIFADVNGNLFVEWLLDGVKFAEHTEDSKVNGTIKPADIATIYLGFVNSKWAAGDNAPTTDNGCTYDWFEFTPAIDWGG